MAKLSFVQRVRLVHQVAAQVVRHLQVVVVAKSAMRRIRFAVYPVKPIRALYLGSKNMKQYLGVVNLEKSSTDYVFELTKELEHWESGKRWVRNQNGITFDVTDEVNKLICDIKNGLELEKADIKREVLTVYPDATGFDLGDGVAYVWRE